VSCQVGTTTGQIDNYAWDWGDGSTASGATKKHPSHTYADAKQYTITLTVSNSGGSSSSTQQVTTTPPPTPSPTPTPAPTPTIPPASVAPPAATNQAAPPSISDALYWDAGLAIVVG
jgi:PKD repeat protein